jgi:hypothetical protein
MQSKNAQQTINWANRVDHETISLFLFESTIGLESDDLRWHVLQFASARMINLHRSDAPALTVRRYRDAMQSAFHR